MPKSDVKQMIACMLPADLSVAPQFALLLSHQIQEAIKMKARTVHILACVALVTTMVVQVSGCSKPGLEYIPSGGSYTLTEAERVASEVSMASVKNVTTESAPSLRTERLLELRSEGDDASRLADALTKDFPSDSAAVPLRVEAAMVDGRRVWLVVEAWGDPTGTLGHRRLWLFDRQTLAVVGSSSFR